MVVFCWDFFRPGVSSGPGQSVAAQMCLTVAEEARHSNLQAGLQLALNYSVINGSGGRRLETAEFQVYLVKTQTGRQDISLSSCGETHQ